MLDLVIKGGLVVDGTGKAGYLADVGVRDGKIAVIDRSMSLTGQETIDARGLVVAPGFVDIHSHTDRTILRNPGAGSSLLQGITTEITGMCGGSAAPITDQAAERYKRMAAEWGGEAAEIPWRSVAEFLEYLDKTGTGTNIALMVGQGTVRGNVLGRETRYPTEDELEAMKSMVRQAMEEGAFGITTGRPYVPGCYASFREIVELCKVAGEYDGLHSSHIQDQWSNVDWASREIVEISRRADIRGQIAHQKVVGKENWGRADELLAIMEDAQARGIDVMADVYPFTYSQVILLKRELPRELARMADDDLMKALTAPGAVEKVRDYYEKSAGYTSVRLYQYGVVHCSKTKQYEWMDIGEVADALGTDVAGAVVRLLVDNDSKVKIAGIISDADVRKIVGHPLVMIGTDALAGDPEKDAKAGYSDLHPRHYGTHPRVLGKYVREEKVLTLEEAVKKMTYLPAMRCNILDRGLIFRGYWADITVFDPLTVKDSADLDDPAAPADGIRYVLVNGKIAATDKKLTGVRAGKALRAAHHRMVY